MGLSVKKLQRGQVGEGPMTVSPWNLEQIAKDLKQLEQIHPESRNLPFHFVGEQERSLATSHFLGARRLKVR